MAKWLVKSDPKSYSWEDMKKDGKTFWDGVRNYQARNNMQEMKNDDEVLFYHSVIGTEVVGICKVVKEAYQDPTTDDERWVAVDLEVVRELANPVQLQDIKKVDKLQDIALIKQSRLSVMPLEDEEFLAIVEMSEK